MVRRHNAYQRAALSDGLLALGLQPIPSQTNFVLLEFSESHHTAEACTLFLRRRGIAVRRVAAPAYKNCVRVTIGLPDQMAAASDAIREFMASD